MSVRREDLLAAVQNSAAGAGLVQAMQARLEGLVGRPSGLIETLPKPVQRRIKFLKRLQEDYDAKEEEYQKELDELDRKYAGIYAPILARRADVVKGNMEAPDDIVVEGNEGSETGPAGVPEFWLGVLRANEVTASQLSEKDEGVLEFLVDIRSEELHDDDQCGFKLTFEFAENPYFENQALTKVYHMVDSDEPVLERAVGCKIDWKSGKNVTIKTLKKKAKPGRGGKSGGRPITKIESVDSFFSFFNPPHIPDERTECDDDELETLQTSLEEDYEIGETIRDELIPNAVRWYSGEVAESDDADEVDDDDGADSDSDGSDADGGSDDDEDDESSNDDGSGAGGKEGEVPKDKHEQPPECKQQ